MIGTEKSEEGIKFSLTQMWQLVAKQIQDAQKAIIEFDTALANDVLVRERLIDNYELQIDKRCEHFAALQNPVAVDLRFVLSHLKMNSNLERIADMAESIAEYVVQKQKNAYSDNVFYLDSILADVLRMLELAYQAYLNNDTNLALKVISMDTKIDRQFSLAMTALAKSIIGKDQEEVERHLYLAQVLRRLERMGDRCTNLAENIIFHIDARELKHANNIPIFKNETEDELID